MHLLTVLFVVFKFNAVCCPDSSLLCLDYTADCLQAIPVDCNPNERGGRTFARESQSIDFTAVASKSKSIAVVEGVEGEVATKHQHHLQHQHQQGGRFTVKSRNTAEQARQLNTVTPENKKLSVTIPLDHGNSRTCRALFHDVTPVTPIASEDTSIKPQTQPHPTPNLSMKRSASLSSLSTPTPSDGYASNTSTRKKIKVSQGPLLKVCNAFLQLLLTRILQLYDALDTSFVLTCMLFFTNHF